MAERPKQIFVDMDRNKLVDSLGQPIGDTLLFPDTFLSNKSWFNLKLYKDSTLADYDAIPAGVSGEVLVDNDFLNAIPTVEIPGGDSDWTVESALPNEYYYNGSGITATPTTVYENEVEMTEGTLGSLAVGEWVWDAVNSLLYVRLSDDADPDTKASGYVTFKPTSTTNPTNPFIEVDSSTFNQASSWFDVDTETYRDPAIVDGEISFYTNANQFNYWDRLGTARQSDCRMQVQLVLSGVRYKIIEVQFICRNRFVGGGLSLELAGVNYYTKAEVDSLISALLLNKSNIATASIDFKTAQENTVYTVPAGYYAIPVIGFSFGTSITAFASAHTYRWLATAVDLSGTETSDVISVGPLDKVNFSSSIYAAGTIFKYEVVAGATGTTVSGKATLSFILVAV